MKSFLLTSILLLNSNKYIDAQVTCTDTPGWIGSDGVGCSWYENPDIVDDDYYYYPEDIGLSRCDAFGACCEDENFVTAAQACCVCGGGSLYETCTDLTFDDGSPWVDIDSDGCDFYEDTKLGDDAAYYDDQDTACEYWGDDDQYRNVYNAKEGTYIIEIFRFERLYFLTYLYYSKST